MPDKYTLVYDKKNVDGEAREDKVADVLLGGILGGERNERRDDDFAGIF